MHLATAGCGDAKLSLRSALERCGAWPPPWDVTWRPQWMPPRDAPDAEARHAEEALRRAEGLCEELAVAQAAVACRDEGLARLEAQLADAEARAHREALRTEALEREAAAARAALAAARARDEVAEELRAQRAEEAARAARERFAAERAALERRAEECAASERRCEEQAARLAKQMLAEKAGYEEQLGKLRAAEKRNEDRILSLMQKQQDARRQQMPAPVKKLPGCGCSL